MNQQRIIQIEQELLLKTDEQNNLTAKYKSSQKMKVVSLIAIPILLVLSLIFINTKEQHEGSYYTEEPYAPVAAFTFFILTPLAIIFSIIGYRKAKKVKPQLKSLSDKVLELKNELIVLKNS
jgi:hypothetical protein